MSLEARLAELKGDFYQFLQNHDDCTSGGVANIQEANPSSSLVNSFCSGDDHKRNHMTMGIAFHGTHSNSIGPICQDGIHVYSSFTSSLHYAVGRNRSNEGENTKELKVLAMAVLVDRSKADFDQKDFRLREPNYSLPLFVLTVRLYHGY